MGKFIEVYRVKLTHSKELYRVMSPHPELTLERRVSKTIHVNFDITFFCYGAKCQFQVIQL